MLMNVWMVPTTVTLMPHAPTLMEVSPVLATKDTVEMAQFVLVCYNNLQYAPQLKDNISMSIHRKDTL